ncbi:MAG: hypothetical protein SGI92_34030, partial [Bryobacteraceae bacterium]|nr:hypothetical protein [Bryobacteraceae bacterium]
MESVRRDILHFRTLTKKSWEDRDCSDNQLDAVQTEMAVCRPTAADPERLKRNKALPDDRGISLAIVDGHESHTSYRRHCQGCIERTIHFAQGERIQYYHRQVTLMLVTGAPAGRPPLRIPLDHEPQRPGEDEVATARPFAPARADRLSARVLF